MRFLLYLDLKLEVSPFDAGRQGAVSRYCVEIDYDSNCYIVHQQKCFNFPQAELIPLGRVVDLGDYSDHNTALTKARQLFPESWSCDSCCRVGNQYKLDFVEVPAPG